jgi:sulfur-oxidizing protein SoxY
MDLTNLSRRALIGSLGYFFALAAIPGQLFAAWPKGAFSSEGVDDAISQLYGHAPQASDQVILKTPEIAENGAVVPVTVSTDIDGVESISVYVEGNPNPLAATFELTHYTIASVATRIKMGKTSNVVAAVYAKGNVYTATQEVKVTIGGCGG